MWKVGLEVKAVPQSPSPSRSGVPFLQIEMQALGLSTGSDAMEAHSVWAKAHLSPGTHRLAQAMLRSTNSVAM